MANYAFELTPIPTPIDEAVTFAHHGVRVDPVSRSARCVLASALLIKGELLAARKELERGPPLERPAPSSTSRSSATC